MIPEVCLFIQFYGHFAWGLEVLESTDYSFKNTLLGMVASLELYVDCFISFKMPILPSNFCYPAPVKLQDARDQFPVG